MHADGASVGHKIAKPPCVRVVWEHATLTKTAAPSLGSVKRRSTNNLVNNMKDFLEVIVNHSHSIAGV